MNFIKLDKSCRMRFHSKCKNYKVEWYFGNVCNSHCSYCFDKDSRKECYRNMTLEETDKVVSFINSLPPLYELLCLGGEPSCFKYLEYGLDRIKHNCVITILTNGKDEEFVKNMLKRGTKNQPMHVDLTAHSEEFLKNKKDNLEHLARLINYKNDNPYSRLAFRIMLDGKKTMEYKELVEFLYNNIVRNRSGLELHVSFIYREGTLKEFVDNIVATTKFDKEIGEFLKNELMSQRSTTLKENCHYGKKCPVLEHFAYIRLDGRLDARPSCTENDEELTHKSIFDEDFDLEEEKENIKWICHRKHEQNWGLCEHIYGKLRKG